MAKGLSIKSALAVIALIAACGAAPVQPPAFDTNQATQNEEQFKARREQMVREQIEARSIRDQRVLDAMRRVPRHRFVLTDFIAQAYEDHPLPIGQGQTISQPYIVGYMTEAAEIQPTFKVLEIGTGSGYQAAILAELAKEIYTIEIIPELAERAGRVLSDLGYKNVEVRAGNGYAGWPERAPFDAIIVTAAPDEVPQALVDQLKVGGRMVVPVGTLFQNLLVITKTERRVVKKRTLPVRFVPMTGKPDQ